jgi:hypothetical protein
MQPSGGRIGEERSNMARCDNCGSTILFGGRQENGLRYCNDRCARSGALVAISQQIPVGVVEQQVWAVHQGRCPQCGGPGPADVHVSHRVWSALLLTSWNSRPRISCRACGVKGQLGAAAFSLLLGWWGLPWGLIMTPVQVGRNLAAMARPPDPTKPSGQLERTVRMVMAANVAAPGETPSGA